MSLALSNTSSVSLNLIMDCTGPNIYSKMPNNIPKQTKFVKVKTTFCLFIILNCRIPTLTKIKILILIFLINNREVIMIHIL